MKTPLKHLFWVFSNWWGAALGWPWLLPLNRIVLNLSLHALGYDNPRFSGESRFMQKILKNQNITVALDIGANVGNYSTELIETLGCTVYAVEPLSSSYAELESCAKSFPDKLLPRHMAFADFTGVASMHAKSPKSEKATLGTAGPHDTITEEVAVTTVDAFVKSEFLKHIDFIKIDTEGYEREVLQGMQDTLHTLKPKCIQFEFNIMQLQRGYTVLDLQKLLPGYALYRLLPHGWVKINAHTFADNIYMFQNIVAARDGIIW